MRISVSPQPLNTEAPLAKGATVLPLASVKDARRAGRTSSVRELLEAKAFSPSVRGAVSADPPISNVTLVSPL